MASKEITPIRTKKQGLRWKARVKVTHKGKIIAQQSRTFDSKPQATSWAKKKQIEMEAHPHGLNGDSTPQLEVTTIAEAISRYINDPEKTERFEGKDKFYVLQRLAFADIGKVMTNSLTYEDLKSHCEQRQRSDTSPSPSTINTDISYLRSLLNESKDYGIEASTGIFDEAILKLKDKGLISKSNRRLRRAKPKELSLIMESLKLREAHRAAHIPYSSIVPFSILTCMRIGEICKIRWEDYDTDEKTILIRDRKDPNNRSNDLELPLCDQTLAIIDAQPRKSEDARIFPYKSQSITAGWQRVRNKLGITNLTYHDLRAEGISRLFEAGWDIAMVAKISGHKNLRVLQTHYNRIHTKKLNSKLNEAREGRDVI
ncbi:site-specific integrase [Vibrio splendidus]|uniref:Site-specific integrase n=1 Tax=Vibrio splendidus TaxID=29497 RepID=A0ABD5AF23_VIBSP|nr:site-specific integrase [Vibrio splendidus]MDP2491837.1 site-specific integrase [Vibrio splendidus]PMO55273.1 hypothetical protein BCT08_13235 [Vibrio splendidus]